MGCLLGQLGNLLPLPGSVGGIDGAMIGAFIALGIGPSAAVVAYRTLSFWLPTLPGIAAYAGLRRELDDTQDAEKSASNGFATPRGVTMTGHAARRISRPETPPRATDRTGL